ncbi:MAG: hypothetical protein ACRDYB_06620 [Acidimicrobiales bacterium]
MVAEVEAITLRQLQWSTNEIDLQLGEEPDIHPTVNIGHGLRGSLLRYQVRATFTGMISGAELFRIFTVHDVIFRLPEDDQASPEELESFGMVTVWFMVYPYLRQELQSLTTNAGLPPILLRPIRLPFNPGTGDAHSGAVLGSGH